MRVAYVRLDLFKEEIMPFLFCPLVDEEGFRFLHFKDLFRENIHHDEAPALFKTTTKQHINECSQKDIRVYVSFILTLVISSSAN